MRYILATSVKNEGLYLLEWLAHHLLLGFDKVVIYSNDNTDESDELLAQLQTEGYIDWRPRVIPEGDSPQKTAFNSLSAELFETEKNNYLIWLDCDEFLVLKEHESIDGLMKYFNFPDALSINWKHFGSAEEIDYIDGLTIDRFKKCSLDTPLNKQVKTISNINPNLFLNIHHHRPVPRFKNNVGRIIYAAPTEKKDVLVNKAIIHGKRAIDLKEALTFFDVCQINHYAVRSQSEYLLKKDRGGGWANKGTNNKRYADEFFKSRDLNNSYEDYTSKKYSEELTKKINDFSPKIKELFSFVKDFYKTKLADLNSSHTSVSEINDLPNINSFYSVYDFKPWEFSKKSTKEEKAKQNIYQSQLKENYPFKIGSDCFVSEKSFIFPGRGEPCSIGDKSWIGAHAYITGKVKIGKNCSLNPFATIRGPFTCGNNVRVASYASVIGFNHGHEDISKPMSSQSSTHEGIVFGNDIWVGAHVSVLAGVSVGSHSILAAGAVVTKDVPEYAVVGGSPAKILRMRNGAPILNLPSKNKATITSLDSKGDDVAEAFNKLVSFSKVAFSQLFDILDGFKHEENGDVFYVDSINPNNTIRSLCNAIELAAMFDQIPQPYSKDMWIGKLRQLQNSESGHVDKDYVTAKNLKHNAEDSGKAISRYEVMALNYALECLGSNVEHPVQEVHNFDLTNLKNTLNNLSWEDRTSLAGDWIDCFMSCLYINQKHHNMGTGAIEELFSWLDQNLDPMTGYWGHKTEKERLLQPINGFYRTVRGSYAQFGYALTNTEKTIDSLLLHAYDSRFFGNGKGNACNVLDVVYPLWLCLKQTTYRSEEITRWVLSRLDATLNMWENFKGFPFDPVSKSFQLNNVTSLQGTEMWLSIIYYMADILGITGALSFKPKGVHRKESNIKFTMTKNLK